MMMSLGVEMQDRSVRHDGFNLVLEDAVVKFERRLFDHDWLPNELDTRNVLVLLYVYTTIFFT